MRCVLLGPPGAGKGSLAGVLKENFGIVHISTGDMLREEMNKQSPIGIQIKELMAHGSLISDEIVTALVKQKVRTDTNLAKGYMLDGFPRTIQQAVALDRMLIKLRQPLNFVLYMDAGKDVIVNRLIGRRVCRQCGALFHVKNKPSKKLNICDLCGGDLYQRSDDNEETICKRIEIYENTTKPVADYYAKQEKLIHISGEKETADVRNDLIRILNEKKSD